MYLYYMYDGKLHGKVTSFEVLTLHHHDVILHAEFQIYVRTGTEPSGDIKIWLTRT